MKTDPYFPLAGFRFTFASIKFVLEHWEQIGEGNWPLVVSGYTQAPLTQSSTRAGAKFVGAAEIWAEISWRLERCGRDGKLALAYHANGVPLEDLVQITGIQDINRIQRRINQAIVYSCGYRRRTESYRDYRRNRWKRVRQVVAK